MYEGEKRDDGLRVGRAGVVVDRRQHVAGRVEQLELAQLGLDHNLLGAVALRRRYRAGYDLSLVHISEPTRLGVNSYVFL